MNRFLEFIADAVGLLCLIALLWMALVIGYGMGW